MKTRKTKNDILMSIAPEWIAKILNGEKTVEIRKRFPNDYVGWVYIYCTKALPLARYVDDTKRYMFLSGSTDSIKNERESGKYINGTVVARFWCDKVEEYSIDNTCPRYKDNYYHADCCLTNKEIYDYVSNKTYKAIHILKLEIFDKPKNVSEFLKPDTPTYEETKAVLKGSQSNYSKKDFLYSQKLFHNIIERAPQSWCYVREA